MKNIFEKYSIAKYIIGAYIKILLFSGVILGAVFVVLKITGLYAQIESVLNLKYNSPFILVPLYGCLILALLGLVVGALMYFHRYKRTKINSVFYKKLSQVLNQR